ncbi:type II secretion system protein [Neobacillus soli]|uniref:type II secretion system protein n=1 Tax=Neobacillus soli TaxID=220688 RepID=UPI0008242599|nr:type II secretion system protein [Neobacillus soli]
MARFKKNENGYTLIIVLLTIMVIGIMAISIMTNIMNSRLQFQKAEEKVQLTKLTKMGKVYIGNAVDTSTNQAKINVLAWLQTSPSPTPTTSQITTRYISELNTEMNKYVPRKDFEIVLKENTYRFKLNVEAINAIDKIVKYTITPSLNGVYKGENSVSGEISINLNIATFP